MRRHGHLSPGVLGTAAALCALMFFGALAVLAGMLGAGSATGCAAAGAAPGSGGAAGGDAASPVVLGPAGSGLTVGATEYGGPGDPSSGDVGASGVNLAANPDSYAELGGTSFATATAMGGLPYGTPLRITWGARSAIAFKRDIGLGGGPVDGHPRVIDLWYELAGALGIPYEDGLWSGPVRIARTPATGAASVLGEAAQVSGAGLAAEPSDGGGGGLQASGEGAGDEVVAGATDAAADANCADTDAATGAVGSGPLTLTPGPRAVLAAGGVAQAPASAPVAVDGIIAAGNAIAGSPYVYGGGHGLPLSEIASSYDCSSSVAHLLWGGGLLPATGDMTSSGFMSWGLPGPGRWVTLYASPDHVFMYVAGLRWDTHDAAGAGDGTTGIGWHPLIREADGFVARHPVGL